MNNAKIAAALHALADAFLEGEAEQPAKTKGKGKTAAAETPAPATTAAVVETPAAEPAQPAAPAVTIKDVNALVLKVAAKNRDGAVALLAKFGLTTTVGLAQDKWQAVYDAFEEEIAKQDAAAVQIQQASLV
jgi:hypothetical protein